MQSTQNATKSKEQINVSGINPEVVEIRNWLVDYVTKSNLLSAQRLHELRDGDGGVPFRNLNQEDTASLTESHMNNMAISDIVRRNVEKSLIIIQEIDKGWDGACPNCGGHVSMVRITSGFSMLCSECILNLRESKRR